MRRSGTCSETGLLRGAIAAAACLTVLAGAAASSAPASAKVFMTQAEALEAAFPGEADVERRTAFLTEAHASEVERLSGEKPPTKLVVYYTGRAGTAYFDTHAVRTLRETIMVLVTPAGAIERIDVLSFGEPEEYLPRRQWMGQFEGRRLDERLSLRQEIRPMTGATLSARAIVAASRRVLALHRLLSEPPAEKEAPRP